MPPYAELRCKTNFSFLRGASHPEELVERAAALGLAALAVTDLASVAGVVRAHVAAKEAGLPLLVGAEVTPRDAPPLVLLAMHRAGYGRLCRLLTIGRRRAPKGECRLDLADVLAHAEGLLAVVAPPDTAPAPFAALLSPLREAFGDRLHAAIESHGAGDDAARCEAVARAARAAGVPLVATNDAHYHDPSRRELHDVLVAIRERTTVAEAGRRLFRNAEHALRGPDVQRARFRRLLGARGEEAVERSAEIASRCRFSLDELRYEYPEEVVPPGETAASWLRTLTMRGAAERWPRGVPKKVAALLEHELALVAELRYEPFFLTVHDVVAFARARGILCQGRGSAANSAVCYCLGITSVDPSRIELLFERFVSKERHEPPDIDVDFEHERREEVFQYVYGKYGRERAGIAAEVICYRGRSAVRDVGKALGLSLDQVDRLAGTLDRYHGLGARPRTLPSPAARSIRAHGVEPPRNDAVDMPAASLLAGAAARIAGSVRVLGRALAPSPIATPEIEGTDPGAARLREAGLSPDDRNARRVMEKAAEIADFPRHLSQHVGGFVISRGPLSDLVPVENAAMEGRTVVQWDKDDLEALGLLKVDLLALGILTATRKSFDLVAKHYVAGTGGGTDLTLATLPPEDPETYEMLCRADAVGVFQVESRAQRAMLPRLRPRRFYDLVVQIAIVRPGPIQGGMVHPYLRRRAGEEPYDLDEMPDLRSVLERTHGVPLFQEQVMRIAVVGAGFTPGDADRLRRAMGAWKKRGVLEGFHRKFVDGMCAHGYAIEFAERVFEQIRGFGEYGFPESHAASFALLAYATAYLKRRYPAAFTAALLNSQPMGFYAPAQLVGDAREHGVEVRAADVGASEWDCTLERASGRPRAAQDGALPEHWGRPGPALRLGLRLVKGLERSAADRIVAARAAKGAFRSVEDCAERASIGRRALSALVAADAFASLGVGRREALWEALGVGEKPPLFAETDLERFDPELPPISDAEQVARDYESTGLSLRQHPMSFLREELDRLDVHPACDVARLPAGTELRVAGIVLTRQRPGTASGVVFVSIEDETGVANLIVPSRVFERDRAAARSSTAIVARGTIERNGEVTHLKVARLFDLPALQRLRSASRDFR